MDFYHTCRDIINEYASTSTYGNVFMVVFGIHGFLEHGGYLVFTVHTLFTIYRFEKYGHIKLALALFQIHIPVIGNY